MNSTYLASLSFGILLALIATVTNAQTASADAPVVGASPACSKSTSKTTPTDLARRIAQLDVERILLGVRFNQVHPELVQLNRRKSGLKACLTQLQPEGYQNLVTAAIVTTTEAKIAELETQYADNQIRFTDDHPSQQYLRNAISALRQHLTTLL
jgi:uncharacterized protein involved in exopolysaccharide biosynthesis